ncbi:helicase protein MOM1-like isoform X2 [Vigna unguiculata]|nr:helicase protein MOM1-like isoform X2 [Vigna unguiculata]
MNTVETYKIRKQQRSIHLLLKPEIANLCEILHLPDNVKSMVQNCLEYTMNNYQICTEPLPILQAFQLSLCLTAAALLNHKLNFEASLLLAKQHLNFDCKKEIVDEINSRLWDLKEKFLSLKGNSNVAGCAKASESSSGAYSYTEVTPEAELVKTDNSVNTKTVQKRKSQWNKLLLMQREEKIKLKKDIENENAEIQRRHQIEWEAIQSCSPGNLTNDGKLQASKSSYMKRTRELNRQQEIRLKDLEVKQLKARLMFQESSAPDELLNPIASNKVGTMVKSLQICDQAQHHNAPKVLVSDHVAEEKGFNDTVEVKERIESGVGSSEAPDANASVVAPFSSTVELQTRLVKNADDEMDIVASKDGLVSEIKCSNIVENEYESLGNIISKHTKSREHRSDGVIRVLDGEECVNINHESHNDFGQNAIQVLPSYNEDIRHGETLDVLSAEVAPLVCNTSSSENDLVEIPSRQGELNGTIQIKPVCGPSIEVAANGSNDGEKNMTLLNSQSSEEHIPSVNTMCTPYCENTAQIHDADNNYGSNNADTLNSSLYDERISSVNSKSPQDRIHNENDKHTLDCETFALNGSGSDNFILNSPLVDERNADRTIVLNRDAHGGIHVAVNLTSSTKEISRGAVNDSVLSSVLSKPCGADSSSNNSSDANAILSNQTSIEKQNHDGVSSSIPVRQVPVGVSETNESAIVNVLDAEEASWMPDAVNYPDNVIPQNSSSMDQLANGGPVFDDNLSSETCTTSPSNSRALPDEHVSVLMPENSLGEVEFQLTHNVVIDKSATLDQQEGVCTTMTENSSYQETPVSRPVDFMESLEQVQSLSFVESPPHLDTTRETQNYVVSSVVDVVQANQSINDSLVMEPPQEGQFPSADFFSSDWDLSNLPLVTRTEDQSYNEDDLLDHIPGTLIEIQNQSFVQHPSNSDQQEGVCRTMIGNSLSQETPISLSVDDLMEPLEQVQPLSSLESPPDQNTTIEMQNSLVSSSVDTVPANVSTNDSLVMEPPGKEGQLPSASILSSNDGDPSNLPTVTGTENQPSNENDLPNHVPETSIEIQDQVVQCTSNVELDSSCLRQDVHPASNMDLVSHVVAVVRQQSSNTRNLSTLTEINNHPIQPASQSDSRIIQRLALDPLKCEMERLHRLVEDNKKDFEERKLKLKQDFEKDLEELYRKFDIKHKENEVEVQKIRKDLDRQHSIVNVNMKLAEACRVKSMNFLLSGSPSMHKDASPVQQLFQVASPQNATAPNVVARPSSREYSAASLQSSYATTTSQTMVPPIQATYSSPGTFSVTPSRLPRINPLTSLLGNVQTGGEIRAPAPHLHPYRAPTPVPASTFCTVLRGRPSQPAPGNIHVTSPPFSYQTPRPAPATFPPVLHGGLWPPTLPVINPHTEPNSQHGTYLPNVRPHMPDLPSMNLSKCDKSSITTATSAHPATSSDVVCLSDDE